METYPIEPNEKQKENKIINHILRSNKYSQTQYYKPKQKYNTYSELQKNKKWAKFTYIGRETRAITNIRKKTGLKIAYTTSHTLQNLLSQHPLRSNQFGSN